ncbi:MAG: hypothetical protein ACXWQE_07930, partial [Bdellovibrionales bacterium]
MRKSRVILSAWLGLGALVMFGFNNCGQVAFEVSSAVKAAALNELLSLSTVDIEGGAAYTRDHQVALALFSPRAVQMKISNNPDCSDGAWEPFAASKTWMLSQSNAQVMVYAQYKDELDQISKCVYDDIIHDDIPPQLTFTNATGLMTNNAALKVEWTATDNISGVDTGTCVDTENQPSNCTSAISTNASAEGTKTVAVKLKDKAGNTAEYKYSWILDKTPPTVVINVRPPLRTKDGTAHFEFSGSDVGTGIDKYFCRKAP